jgi:hypothetical protein
LDTTIAAGAGAGGGGWIQIVDITPTGAGAVGSKTYQTALNNILLSCETDTLNLDVLVESSGPRVRVNAVTQDLNQLAGTAHYSGVLSVTIPGSSTVTATQIMPTNIDGASAETNVTVSAGPEVLTATFTGGYPGSQTELKAGDTFQLVGTTDTPADAIDILDFGAFAASLEVIVESTNFTVTGTVADRGTSVQDLPARIRARNSFGAFGSTFDTDSAGVVDGTHRLKLNNLYPTATIGVITYPVSQTALKGAETASISMTTADFDTINYTSPNGDLSITNPALDEPNKSVQRIAGTYNDSVDNFQVSANRAANDATTVDAAVVVIANVAAVITVTEPAARLRSGGNDGTAAQDYLITLTSDQDLPTAPSLTTAPSTGTFTTPFAGGPKIWTRTLQVHDNDTKGIHSWLGLSATNRAGLVTAVITGDSNYTLGGFVARDITFAAFAQTAFIGTAATDYSKIQAGVWSSTNQPSIKNAIQGNTDDLLHTYTIQTMGANPATLFWNDLSAANSNSSGTAALLDIEEVV